MNMSEELSFSIVICTYNRDEYLERTLESLNSLDYSNFEVIVVNGPSTDNTDQVLKKYTNRIKVFYNPAANLSVSRNIGIKAAQGDVVAFIDDDAIPEPNWLHQIKEVYDKHSPIGGAGGRVYGPGGDHFQFHNGIINIWGEADVKRDYPGEFTQPVNDNYNILMGVNSTFLKSALIEIGGFDEYYEYYHDESDVCVRLAKSGRPIYHHEEAYIHHEFAKSHIRTTNYKLNWYPIVKNTVYFGIKNSKGVSNFFERITVPVWVAYKRMSDFKQWLREGNITKEDFRTFRKMWLKGMVKGFLDGFFTKRRVNCELVEDGEFFIFPKEKRLISEITQVDKDDEQYGICYLSRYYPPFHNGGVGTYTKVLAEGIAKQGYPVYVITSDLPEKEMTINGVKLISIDKTLSPGLFDFIPQTMNVTKTNLEYSLKASCIVDDLYSKGLIKILESPLWDYEGLISTKIEGLKTFVRLETPLKVAAETQNWVWNNDFELSSRLEKLFIESCTAVIPISKDIKKTIGEMYHIHWDTLNVKEIPLGIKENTNGQKLLAEINLIPKQDTINVLFLGRLERRKGVDILLKAAINICKSHSHVRFIIAGDNTIVFQNNKTVTEIYKSDLLPFSSQIIFTGEISDQDKNKLLAECDIFVAPSRYESFGLVYLEAMQLAKPVVGTYVGGVKEIIGSQEIGLLVKKESVKELEDALLELLKDRNLRKKMGIKGRERYKKNYTSEIMINRTIDYYSSFYFNT